MEIQKFKTNIKCGACIATVTPFLNGLSKVENWEVDTSSPDKTLTVKTKEDLQPAEVISALNKAGYQAETLS
jgi:copper chaperone